MWLNLGSGVCEIKYRLQNSFLIASPFPPNPKLKRISMGPRDPSEIKYRSRERPCTNKNKFQLWMWGKGEAIKKLFCKRYFISQTPERKNEWVRIHFFAPSQFSLELFGRARDLLMLPCHYFETQITAHAGPSSQTAGRRGGASQRGRLTDRKSRPQG